jgi:hypothetical protein
VTFLAKQTPDSVGRCYKIQPLINSSVLAFEWQQLISFVLFSLRFFSSSFLELSQLFLSFLLLRLLTLYSSLRLNCPFRCTFAVSFLLPFFLNGGSEESLENSVRPLSVRRQVVLDLLPVSSNNGEEGWGGTEENSQSRHITYGIALEEGIICLRNIRIQWRLTSRNGISDYC